MLAINVFLTAGGGNVLLQKVAVLFCNFEDVGKAKRSLECWLYSNSFKKISFQSQGLLNRKLEVSITFTENCYCCYVISKSCPT